MKETGQKILEVSQKLINKRIYQRLNSTVCPEETTANDVSYHKGAYIMYEEGGPKDFTNFSK